MRLPYRIAPKPLLHILTVLMLLNMGTAPVLQGYAAPAPQTQGGFATVALPEGAASLPADFPIEARRNANPKLDSVLAAIAEQAALAPEGVLDLAQAQQVRTLGDRLLAQINVQPQDLDAAMKAVQSAGGEVTGHGNADRLIQAWLPFDSLEALATQETIGFIYTPAQVVLDEVDATTEGLAVMNGTAWHSAGYVGAGVKVGIIDAGFQGYTTLLGSDLPAGTIVKNFVDGENDSQVDGTSPHGTACAEIVYDIVPGATIYLAKIGTSLDVQEAVNWLKDTHHVNVISTSFSFFNTAPGDGTGYLADMVQTARDAGILWAKSAGNYRERHWGGLYSDPNGNDYHNFNGDQEINFFGPGDGSAYSIPSGYTLRVYLRWSDWTNVNQDFDFHLVRWNGSSWNIIASSTNTQNGSVGQTPTETVAGLSTGDSAPYGVIIESVSSTQSVNFEILAPSVAEFDEQLHARSLGDIADAPAAMTVAALDVTAPYPQEDYSSEGPTNGPGGIATGGAIKPDISGFANVSTESYGTTNKFNGTSSATPHVAGAAALVKSAYPSYTPDQLQSFLEGRAVDMGTAGKDTLFGAGQLYLGNPPTTATGKTWNGSASTDWHNAANWTPNGVPTATDDVTIPDVSNDPRISSANAQADNLTIAQGVVLDLTTRVLSVEGTLVNNGTLKQTRSVSQGQASNFLRITNQAGTQTKYYGLDLTPATINPTLSSGSLQPSAAPASQDGSGFLEAAGEWIEQGALLFKRITGMSLVEEETPQPTTEPSKVVELKLDSIPIQGERPMPESFPEAPGDPVSMVLDDGIPDVNSGVNNSTNAHQFIWLNRFTPDPANFPLVINEIWVMFDNSGGTTNVYAGDDIDLVIYRDADTNPANGATYLAKVDETVQAVDGVTWSKFTLSSPVTIQDPGDVLIAVINRFTVSGVSPLTYPATQDTTSGQDRSWIGWWYDIPPDPPVLPPNASFFLMTEPDDSGNWMIRAYGEVGGSTTPTETPTPTPTATPDPTTTPSTQVTVSISGEQHCQGKVSGVERCYDIAPAAGMTARVRFYFTESERGGYALSNLLVYHYDTAWAAETGPFTYGGSGDAQYVEDASIASFSLFALDTDSPVTGHNIFLPNVIKNAGPPSAPALSAIDNADGDGDYTVSWSVVGNASEYELQEDDNAAFSSPETIYSGASTSQAMHKSHIGTYYYRVRAHNSLGYSPWSNVQSVYVATEPPETCELHTFGDEGVTWFVYSSGKSWNFVAQNTMAVERIEVKSVLASTRGITFNISIKINDVTIDSWSQYVNDTSFKAYIHNADVSAALAAGDKITYRIAASAGSGEAAIAWYNYVELCGR